jgi:hypothetical protein
MAAPAKYPIATETTSPMPTLGVLAIPILLVFHRPLCKEQE